MTRTAATNPDTEADREQARALWESDRGRLMVSQPFLAMLAIQLDLVPVRDRRLDTAATDGRSVFVDIEFLLGLTREERLFVLAHEVWHCAGRHFLRRGHREAERWNLAADHEVNALLQEQGLTVPEDAVLYPEMAGENAETVYDWLEYHPERQRSRAPWADVHEQIPSADEGSDPALAPGPGDWGAWPQRLVAAAEQAERRGTLPAGVRRQVHAAREPQLPWQELLRRFLTRDLSAQREWTPPNRRFAAQGLYLPRYRRQPRLDITVSIDTSRSTQQYLEYFVAELNGIVKAFGDYRIRLLQCDTAVHSDTVHTPCDPLHPDMVALNGGGGTDLRPIFQRLSGRARPDPLVAFTDGKGEAPEVPPPFPCLWVLTHSGASPARWGDRLIVSSSRARCCDRTGRST